MATRPHLAMRPSAGLHLLRNSPDYHQYSHCHQQKTLAPAYRPLQAATDRRSPHPFLKAAPQYLPAADCRQTYPRLGAAQTHPLITGFAAPALQIAPGCGLPTGHPASHRLKAALHPSLDVTFAQHLQHWKAAADALVPAESFVSNAHAQTTTVVAPARNGDCYFARSDC